MNKKQFLLILTKYLDDKATEQEIHFLHAYYNMFMADADVILLLKDNEKEKLKLSMKVGIDEYINQQTKPAKKLLPWPLIAAAATVILVAGLFLYKQKTATDQITAMVSKKEIAPGSNKAILTMANGKVLSLTDAANGIIAQQGNVSVRKSKNGQLTYMINNSSPEEKQTMAILWNTITTPKGGQWQVILPDGTKVWLNAASSLTYPEYFKGNKREVKLQGEAYFEVAHNKKMPFHVSSKNQDVEVLGTHFNVNAYADESFAKTTLLEGSVKLWQPEKKIAQLLKPDQEAILSSVGVKVSNVDAQDAIAWKDGVFLFNDDHLDVIMKKISRWYDVDVQFKDEEMKKELFSGTVSRFAKISQVLRKLEALGGVAFHIEGHKIIVMKK